MIQRYFKVAGSRDAILAEILAFDAWPQWWPGVQSVRVVRDDRVRPTIDVVVKTVATIQMTLQFDCSNENTIQFRQLKGWFKSYQGEYALLPASDSSGTTIKITIELESGMMVPKGMVYTKLSATLGQLEEALNRRLSARANRASSPENLSSGPSLAPAVRVAAGPLPLAIVATRRNLGHIFETSRGFEVWVAGMPYQFRPVAR